MKPAVALLGLVIVGILLWLYMREDGGLLVDRRPVLSANQQATLDIIKTRARKDIQRKLAQICAMKSMLVTLIRNAKVPPQMSEKGSCAILKTKVKEEIVRMVVQLGPDKHTDMGVATDINALSSEQVPHQPRLDEYDAGQAETIGMMISLWMDKAFDRYCPDTENFELFKEHAVRAIKDICSHDGDFARMLYQAADYAVTKPLSMMS
jgi:hypothetical protein